MLHVYRTSRFPFFIGFLFFAALIFFGLPFFFLLIASFLAVSLIRNLLTFLGVYQSKPKHPDDPHVSPVIKNKKIGSYRIRKNDRDPDVIEVIQE